MTPNKIGTHFSGRRLGGRQKTSPGVFGCERDSWNVVADCKSFGSCDATGCRNGVISGRKVQSLCVQFRMSHFNKISSVDADALTRSSKAQSRVAIRTATFGSGGSLDLSLILNPRLIVVPVSMDLLTGCFDSHCQSERVSRSRLSISVSWSFRLWSRWGR